MGKSHIVKWNQIYRDVLVFKACGLNAIELSVLGAPTERKIGQV